MPRSEVERLNDARIAIERIVRYTTGMTFEDYLQSDKDQSAAERQFEILSEALTTAVEQNPALESELPYLSRLVGMRNILAHRYHAVDNRIIWDAIGDYLPSMLAYIRYRLGDDNDDWGSTKPLP